MKYLFIILFILSSLTMNAQYIKVLPQAGLTSEVKDAPEEVWLVECQRCFLQRIIYPSDRVASREDDIVRCDKCGGWKMKAAKCRICRLAAGLASVVASESLAGLAEIATQGEVDAGRCRNTTSVGS